MSRLGVIGSRLYRGEVSFDFVGRQKLWYSISGLILIIAVVAFGVRGLHYSVEFKGGNVFQFSVPGATQHQISTVVANAGGGGDALVQQLGAASHGHWQVQTTPLNFAQASKVQDAIASSLHVAGGRNNVSTQLVGASWGSQISHKALEGLIVFLVLIVIYLSIAFEWKMAVAAFVALLHDIVITVGVYALAGFQVSPATVIGLLTILGYSLYDTVVVFDKVRENTAGLLATDRSSYSQAANLALNQTLVRSINTSLTALLPVTAILVVAVVYLGTGELQDLALVLFVGMLSGTYSSICIATPVLADLKEREAQYKQLAVRAARRAAGGRAAQRAAKAQTSAARRGGSTAAEPVPAAGSGPDTAAAPAPATVSGVGPDTDPADDDYDEAPADADAADAGPDEPVPAVRGASGGPAPRSAPGARPGPRQQPRRSSSARRRPAGKKKRR